MSLALRGTFHSLPLQGDVSANVPSVTEKSIEMLTAYYVPKVEALRFPVGLLQRVT